MSATVEEIREAMADALSAIPGVQASGYGLSNPTLPSAQVYRGNIEYDLAMQGGTHLLHMTVRVLVADLNDIAASKNLDRYLEPDGDLSVSAALEADTTLGGIVQALDVISANGEQTYGRENGTPMLGSEWTVDIWL